MPEKNVCHPRPIIASTTTPIIIQVRRPIHDKPPIAFKKNCGSNF
jgi:hypothetical protein